MSVRFFDNIEYKGTKPLDNRVKYNTIAEMKSTYSSRQLCNGLIALVEENKKQYIYDSGNSDDDVTGKWREYLQPITNEEIGAIVK